MSKRPHKPVGPISWLLAAFRADPVGVIAWTVVLVAGMLISLCVAVHFAILSL